MGFFKDMRTIKQAGDEAMRQQGYKPGLMGTMKMGRDGLSQAAGMMGEMQAGQQVMATGVPGQATITDIADTGMTVNENPVVRLGLDVTVPGRAPYHVDQHQMISRVTIGSFQPGAQVPVRVDPQNPGKLIIG